MNNQQKVGVLLVNVGTPQAPTEEAVYDYLKEFLSDPLVVNLPRWIWYFLLNFVILKSRPKRLSLLYQKIWTAEGSPLYAISLRQKKALESFLVSESILVKLGMRYGYPSVKDALTEFKQQEITQIILVPLFPQYAEATVGSVNRHVSDCLKNIDFRNAKVKTIEPYFADSGYVAALAESIDTNWSAHHKGEVLLFSYHGLPLNNADSQNYFRQCEETTTAVAKLLHLASNKYKLCFQSRFGLGEWLRPYTDHVLRDAAKKGVKEVDLICPGFAADCLETLEEIKVRYAENFRLAGGEKLNYIPCLNDNLEFINSLKEIILKNSPN